jgi:hypothetical protein
MARHLTAADRSALIRLASTLPAGSEERKAILAGLEKSSRSRMLQKVQKMTDAERKRLSFDDVIALDREQYQPAVDAIVRKVTSDIASAVNAAARKLDIFYIDTVSGELRESPYKAKGLLEQVIPDLTEALENMV